MVNCYLHYMDIVCLGVIVAIVKWLDYYAKVTCVCIHTQKKSMELENISRPTMHEQLELELCFMKGGLVINL